MEVAGMRGLFLVLVGSVVVLFFFSSLALIRQRRAPQHSLASPPRQRRNPSGSEVEESSEAKFTHTGHFDLTTSVPATNALKMVTPEVKVARNIKVAADDDVSLEGGHEGSFRTRAEDSARSDVKARSRRQGRSGGQITSRLKVARTKRNGTHSKPSSTQQKVQTDATSQDESRRIKTLPGDRPMQHVRSRTSKNATSQSGSETQTTAKTKVRSKSDAQANVKVKSGGGLRGGSSVKAEKNVGVRTNQHRRKRRRTRSKSLSSPVASRHGNRVESGQSMVKVGSPEYDVHGTQSAMLVSGVSATPSSRIATPPSRLDTPTSRSATPTSRLASPTFTLDRSISRLTATTFRLDTPVSTVDTATSTMDAPLSSAVAPTFGQDPFISWVTTPTSRSFTPTSGQEMSITEQAIPTSMSDHPIPGLSLLWRRPYLANRGKESVT